MAECHLVVHCKKFSFLLCLHRFFAMRTCCRHTESFRWFYHSVATYEWHFDTLWNANASKWEKAIKYCMIFLFFDWQNFDHGESNFWMQRIRQICYSFEGIVENANFRRSTVFAWIIISARTVCINRFLLRLLPFCDFNFVAKHFNILSKKVRDFGIQIQAN